jgi:hypothetical protein
MREPSDRRATRVLVNDSVRGVSLATTRLLRAIADNPAQAIEIGGVASAWACSELRHGANVQRAVISACEGL